MDTSQEHIPVAGLFRFTGLHHEQFRCLELLDLSIEPDLSVLFARNGSGKTAAITALAVGITAFPPRTPRALKLDQQWDARKITLNEREHREPAGLCTVTWKADVGPTEGVSWSSRANPAAESQVQRPPVDPQSDGARRGARSKCPRLANAQRAAAAGPGKPLPRVADENPGEEPIMLLPIARQRGEFRTRRVVLEGFDALARDATGRPYVSPLGPRRWAE